MGDIAMRRCEECGCLFDRQVFTDIYEGGFR